MNLKKTIGLFIYVLALSIVLAYLEIQIEGTDGWGKNLPTWKVKISNFEITGYHLSLWLLIFVFLHFPVFFTKWSFQNESFILSFFILTLLLEDSFWFLLNSKFKGKKDVWREPKIGVIPQFYFLGAFASLFFALFARSLNWFICVLFLLLINTASFIVQIQ
jgi:hypothetical protein